MMTSSEMNLRHKCKSLIKVSQCDEARRTIHFADDKQNISPSRDVEFNTAKTVAEEQKYPTL